MDNPDTRVPLGPQNTYRGKKQNNKLNTTQKAKTMSNKEITKTLGWTQHLSKGKQFNKLENQISFCCKHYEYAKQQYNWYVYYNPFTFQGLDYLLRSSLRYHGNLKSSNCLVDGRFVLKLGDYGPRDWLKTNDKSDRGNFMYY